MSKKVKGIYSIYFHRAGDNPDDYNRDIIVVASCFNEAVKKATKNMRVNEDIQSVEFIGTVDVE